MEKEFEDIETSENNDVETEEQTEETTEGEETPDVEAKLKELEENNKKLYARLKKAEAEAKKPKQETDEEKLLRLAKLSTSLDDDDLEVLKTLAGASLEDKVKNPLFLAYKEQKDKKAKAEAAALKPSTAGRIYSGDKDDPNEPGISQEEHRKRVEKMMS